MIKQSLKKKRSTIANNPPKRKQVIDYIVGMDGSMALAVKFWEHYTADEDHYWLDKGGSPVLSWKQKALTWIRREKENGHNSQSYI